MSSPASTCSAPAAEPQGVKRKFDADSDSPMPFKVPASEIQLPSDPLRRASIINLATAAAAAVLQSQVGQRRMSANNSEQDQKRQRVEQLGMLIEQARKASVGTMSLDISRHIESASQNVAIATALANHLGLTPTASRASTPTATMPSSPTKEPAKALGVPATPTTPKSPLASQPINAAQLSDDSTAARHKFASSVEVVDKDEKATKIMQRPSSPTSPSSMPAITLSKTDLPPGTLSSGESILDEAREAAQTYSRFYLFEKEWAHKALELERRRSSVRIDPLHNPNPTLPPLAEIEDNARGPASPKQHSAPQSRIMSRGTSPFGDAHAAALRTPHSAPSGSFSSQRGSSSGLVNVLSNLAELIEHRQQSCSGLEALAEQAKELPVKRLSQPNPHLRTTFGDFSWAKKTSSGLPVSNGARSVINEGDGDSDTSSWKDEGSVHSEAVGAKSPARPSLLHVKSDKKVKQQIESDGDTPATPRSTMSIASLL